MKIGEQKVEDYRFALQECTVCKCQFPVIYQFKEKEMVPFGKACHHVEHEGATFIPIQAPTFKDWYENQVRIRALQGK